MNHDNPTSRNGGASYFSKDTNVSFFQRHKNEIISPQHPEKKFSGSRRSYFESNNYQDQLRNRPLSPERFNNHEFEQKNSNHDRDFLSRNSNRYRHNHSDVENEYVNYRKDYDALPNFNSSDQYNHTYQDDISGQKPSRGVSARGSFARGNAHCRSIYESLRNDETYHNDCISTPARSSSRVSRDSNHEDRYDGLNYKQNNSVSINKENSRPSRRSFHNAISTNTSQNVNSSERNYFGNNLAQAYQSSCAPRNYSSNYSYGEISRDEGSYRSYHSNILTSNDRRFSYDPSQLSSMNYHKTRNGSRRSYETSSHNNDRESTRGSYRGGRSGGNFYDNASDNFNNDRESTRGSYRGGRGGGGNSYENGSNSFNNDRESTRGSYRGGRGGGGSSYENGSNSFNNDRESTRGSYRGGRSGGNFYDNASDNFNNDRESTRGSYRGGRGRVGNFYDNGSDNFNNDRESTRGSFRGGRGGDRFPRRFDSDINFEDRDHSRNNPFSDVPAIDPASRAPRGWVPAKHDVEKYFEEDRNKEKYSEFDMDEKFKTTGGKDIQYKTWDETGLHEKLLADLTEKCHFKKVRPIQGRVIPHVLAKCNLLGHSQTGSGKTLAYVLPILHHLLTSEGFGENIFYNPKVLVIVPTRELAVQVYNEFRKFASGTNINIGVAFGQYSRKENLADIANVHVIIGTVGRIKDFTSSSNLDVRNLSHIVLDEADKILKESDRAFQEMIHDAKFRSVIPKCQVLMFTATLPTAFDKLTTDLLGSDYVTITNEERMKANNHVEQIYVHTATKKEKHDELKKIIENHSDVKILIFVKTKDMADILSGTFEQQGLKIESLHGGRPQNLRDQIFNNFKAGGTQIVIGTDVCGRGWDIDGLDIVVNFDMPSSMESMDDCMDTFIHRIGRTGRMKNGKAITFISDEDKDFVPHLIKLCQASQQEVPEFMLEIEKNLLAILSLPAAQPTFGNTYTNIQTDTSAWDLSAKSNENFGNADSNEIIPATVPMTSDHGDDAWASPAGWGDDTPKQNSEVIVGRASPPRESTDNSWNSQTKVSNEVILTTVPMTTDHGDDAWASPAGWGDDTPKQNSEVIVGRASPPRESTDNSGNSQTKVSNEVILTTVPMTTDHGDDAWASPAGWGDDTPKQNSEVIVGRASPPRESTDNSGNSQTKVSNEVILTTVPMTTDHGDDAWTSPAGWGDDTPSSPPTTPEQNSEVFVDRASPPRESTDNSGNSLRKVELRISHSNDPTQTVRIRDPTVEKETIQSEKVRVEHVPTSIFQQENPFGALDDWDTSGAVWGTGADDNKPTNQSDDEDEKLLPSNTNDNGGGEY